MRPFRGNCQQVAILEGQLIASGMAMQVDSVQDPPLFSIQREFKPKVITNKYMVRTDIKKDKDGKITSRKFFPEMYSCKFVYHITTNKGESHMDREVVNLLLELIPEPLQSQLRLTAIESNNREEVKL